MGDVAGAAAVGIMSSIIEGIGAVNGALSPQQAQSSTLQETAHKHWGWIFNHAQIMTIRASVIDQSYGHAD